MDLKNKKNLWIYRITFILIGGVLGYFYWLKIGCASGSCAITSVWHNTVLYGGLLGYLTGDILKDLVFKAKSKEDEQLSKDS